MFSFTLVDDKILRNCLREIKPKAVGSDGINIHRVVFSCPNIVPYILLIINNSCILDCWFPGACRDFVTNK